MKTTLLEDLNKLAATCFIIESKLPYKAFNESELLDGSDIRRSLYRIRVEVNTLSRVINTFGIEYENAMVNAG